MKNYLVSLIIALLAVLIPSCKTAKVTTSDPTGGEEISLPASKIRPFVLLPEALHNPDPEIVRQGAADMMRKIANANHNVVFLSPGAESATLNFAIIAAHENGLKLYAGIDLTDTILREPGISLSQIYGDKKRTVRQLVENHNLDGLFFSITDDSYDIVEDLAVEAMLVKPYLVMSVVYRGEGSFDPASRMIETGIADFIIDEGEIPISNQEFPGSLFSDKVSIPYDLKRITPRQIVGLDLSALFPGNHVGQPVFVDNINRTRVTDTSGSIGFIMPTADSITIRTANEVVTLRTADWSIPFRYAIDSEMRAVRKAPWVEFRRMPQVFTDSRVIDILCKTEYPAAAVTIGGVPVKQYKTGIFFSTLTLNEGANRIRATVVTADSLTTFYEREFVYEKRDRSRKTFPLWIDRATAVPASAAELLRDDVVKVSFQGSARQNGFVVLNPGGLSVPCSRVDYSDYSLYRADVSLSSLVPGVDYGVTAKLVPEAGSTVTMPLELSLPGIISVRNLADFPLLRVVRANSRLVYNLGAPRLGGPIRSELGPGVVLQSDGLIGENYRVRLSRIESGFIHKSEVEVLGKEAVRPSFNITSMSCLTTVGRDILTIPYLEPVPYEVYPEPDQKRIVITLFGAESSSTWITHGAGRKVIDRVTWQQTTPETFQVYVNLKTDNMWGYDVRVEGSRLVLRIKHPPVYDLLSEKPLAGLRIAVEAGHGGSNTGAIGLSGLLEKDINMDVSLRLGELLSQMGAEVIQLREADIDMTLIEKRDKALQSGADMLISIHANAGGTGFLQVSGTSTYWHNPFWAPLAELVYNRLLELPLAEFGVVGSFNYTVTRASQMPSILVEQAFMSHAEDEEKMADPDFRQQMVVKIYEGILDYLKYMKR
jgi:N-acetylmuramoyl-L-alanine amidase